MTEQRTIDPTRQGVGTDEPDRGEPRSLRDASPVTVDEALAIVEAWPARLFRLHQVAAVLAEEVNRMRAALPVVIGCHGAVSDWQPIETAPKEEGIWILAARTGQKIPVVTGWDEDESCWFTFNLWLETEHRRKEPNWVFEPTNWMPLPAAPTKDQSMSGSMAEEVLRLRSLRPAARETEDDDGA